MLRVQQEHKEVEDLKEFKGLKEGQVHKVLRGREDLKEHKEAKERRDIPVLRV